ncbi:hypothetical protein [Shewanella baltica]|uniref:hypothetical protein n=1 Tax=Shewanella baltica TaxID=62322 RepID=UPI00216864BC|nr:hypothetical protein [Shewanella baltica]MCS6116842.1 hypothetical protein [Shewanella baltica]MCS6162422.1 hypothetical protein [Shewanella baltica]UVW66502.1 hypothetical protein HHE93_23500 [Shewanella baltica]
MLEISKEDKAAKDQRVVAWLGDTYVTNGVNALTPNHSDKLALTELFYRHAAGDWGDMAEADKKLNDDMFVKGGRVLSTWSLGTQKIYIITEPDRTRTTAMLLNDYLYGH